MSCPIGLLWRQALMADGTEEADSVDKEDSNQSSAWNLVTHDR